MVIDINNDIARQSPSIMADDIGAILVDAVGDAINQSAPIMADDQLAGIRARASAGDRAQNCSRANYL